MKLRFSALALIFLSGCSTCYIEEFPLDGKAVSSCQRKKRAQELCRKHDGLNDYYYKYAKCNDGAEFREEVQ